MKNLIYYLTFFLLLFVKSNLCVSQMQIRSSSEKVIVGNVKRGPVLISELSYNNREDSLNNYTLKFLDASSEILKSIEFKCSSNKIDELYVFLNLMLSSGNGSNDDFLIADHRINVTTQKVVGMKNVLITINESFGFGLNKNEIQRLFGK